MNVRDRSIDVIKGIAIILVVCGHIIQRTMVLGGKDFFLNPVFAWIYSFHMPLFVFLGGYLMAGSLERKSPGAVFVSRCQSLLIPFLVWGVLGVFTNGALDVLDGKKGAVGAFYWGFIDQLVVNPSVWFLSTLFMLSALLLFSVQLRERFGVLTFWFVGLLVILIPWNQYGGIYYVQWFLPFYFLGYFANHFQAIIRRQWLSAMPVAAAFVAFCVLESFWVKVDYIYVNKMVFHPGHFIEEALGLVYRVFVGFLGILCSWSVGSVISGSGLGAALSYIGGYALDIYLIQRYLVEGLYPRLAGGLRIAAIVDAPVLFYSFVLFAGVFSVLMCIFLSNVFIRRNQWLNRLSLGARG